MARSWTRLHEHLGVPPGPLTFDMVAKAAADRLAEADCGHDADHGIRRVGQASPWMTSRFRSPSKRPARTLASCRCPLKRARWSTCTIRASYGERYKRDYRNPPLTLLRTT
ncbi:hypothetical protein GCM10010233_61550 [Streptomyces pseudogriseolus]|nr:hypothetical protein GCM10010233_61550 [Streptomyces gancidicus]